MVSEFKQLTEVWPSISMVLHPPHNEKDLNELVELCDYLIDQTGGDEEHSLMELLDIVGTLIENYESQHIPEPQGDAIGCLKYLMQEHGLKQKDLTELGSPGVISEILSEKRELNKRQIKALSERFNCSPAIFI
ncbi:MAG: helix-turn-helix domain-containing protein [SAR324 cluster bacterium]|nr:helix-turn-helix domain-containing protein [SAR324 cluster bacterium]